jgi:hypothetical protein
MRYGRKEPSVRKCEACLAMEANLGQSIGHGALRSLGRRGTRRFFLLGPRIAAEHFVCRICGTRWAFRNREDNGDKGWSLVQ